MTALDETLATRLAATALGHVAREYPHVLLHTLTGPEPALSPRQRHPVFFGSYDWHSCVHAHWLLVTVARLYPAAPIAADIAAHFDAAFTAPAIETERAYLARPASAGFERPYGWAWLLRLAAELARHDTPQGRRWDAALAPLADVIVGRFKTFLPKADYPLRAGVHSNTAFALLLARDYAEVSGDADLAGLIAAKARSWYGADRACQAWEPSGDEFLSPALIEAALMRAVLPATEFDAWLAGFLPDLAAGQPATLFQPARVSDRADGKIAHLDGLNLSRAWCWRVLARGRDDHLGSVATDAADRHLAAGLPHVSGDYMGEHWLASFALLALLA